MALSDMEHLCLEVVRMVFTSSGDLAVSRRTPSWPWRSGARLELQRKQYQALFFSSKCTSSMSRLVFRTSKVICFPSPSALNAAKSICFNVVVASEKVNTNIHWFCNWHVKLKTLQGTISHKVTSHTAQILLDVKVQESDKSQIFYWSSQTCTRIMQSIGWWIVNHAQKPENGPISDLVPSYINQYRHLLTQ